MKRINYNDVVITDISNHRTTDPDDMFKKFKNLRVFSQLHEDGVLEFIFSVISPKKKGYYVEFGAWDGEQLSNTANLRVNKEWTGLLLESDKEKVLSMENREEINLHCEMVTSKNINTLFAKYDVPKNFDFLSIDIDSDDYYVWRALEDYRPRIVVVETNPGISNDLPLSIIEGHANTRCGYFGANLHAFYNLAKRKGYQLLTVNKWNAFFICDEEFKHFGIEPITREVMISQYCVVQREWATRQLSDRGTTPNEWAIVD